MAFFLGCCLVLSISPSLIPPPYLSKAYRETFSLLSSSSKLLLSLFIFIILYLILKHIVDLLLRNSLLFRKRSNLFDIVISVLHHYGGSSIAHIIVTWFWEARNLMDALFSFCYLFLINGKYFIESHSIVPHKWKIVYWKSLY